MLQRGIGIDNFTSGHVWKNGWRWEPPQVDPIPCNRNPSDQEVAPHGTAIEAKWLLSQNNHYTYTPWKLTPLKPGKKSPPHRTRKSSSRVPAVNFPWCVLSVKYMYNFLKPLYFRCSSGRCTWWRSCNGKIAEGKRIWISFLHEVIAQKSCRKLYITSEGIVFSCPPKPEWKSWETKNKDLKGSNRPEYSLQSGWRIQHAPFTFKTPCGGKRANDNLILVGVPILTIPSQLDLTGWENWGATRRVKKIGGTNGNGGKIGEILVADDNLYQGKVSYSWS